MKTRLFLVSSLLVLGLSSNAQWVVQSPNFAATARGTNVISLPNATTVWGGAYDGTPGGGVKIQEFTRTTDAGVNYTAGFIRDAAIDSTEQSTFGLSNLCAVDANTAWAAFWDSNTSPGANQGIYKTTDGGTTWTRQATAAYGTASFADFVYFWDANHGVAVGDPQGGYYEVYTTSDGGTSWTRTANTGSHLSPAPSAECALTNCYSVSGSTIWFGTTHGRIFKSTDKGLTWTHASTPFTITSAAVSSAHLISKVAFRDANNGMACITDTTGGTTKSKYVKTSDGGTNWTSVTSTGFNYGSDFCAVPGTSIYVSVGGDPAFKGSSMSTDDGATWASLEDTAGAPQRLSVAFYSASLGYAGGFDEIDQWSGTLNPFGIGIAANKTTVSSVVMYPNPTAGYLNISLNGFAGKKASVKIYNVIGEQVYSSENIYETPVYIKHIDLSALQAGVYIVTVYDGTQSFVQRITKQ